MRFKHGVNSRLCKLMQNYLFIFVPQAMDIRPGDRNILILRSKCNMFLGKYDIALKDANRALEQDKFFFRAIFQKAESHFSGGEFELALIYYHRGMKVRPDLEDFRLGIQKAQKAIEDAINGVDTHNLVHRSLDEHSNLDASVHIDPSSPRVVSKTVGPPNVHQAHPPSSQSGPNASQSVACPAIRDVHNKAFIDKASIESHRSTRSVHGRAVLGKLDGDKQFLQQLLADPKIVKKSGGVSAIAAGGLQYLDKREDFWRQQNGEEEHHALPAVRYRSVPTTDRARQSDSDKKKKRQQTLLESSGRSSSVPNIPESNGTTLPPIGGASHHPKSAGMAHGTPLETHHSDSESPSPSKGGKGGKTHAGHHASKTVSAAKMRQLIEYFVELSHECVLTLHHIDKAYATNDPETSLRFAREFLANMGTMEVPDKPRIVTNLHHIMGSCYAILNKHTYAAAHFRKELEISLAYEFEDSVVRSISSLGRTFLKMGVYTQALEALNIKIGQGPESEIPETYLNMGRCYFELENYNNAAKYAALCLQWLDQKPPKVVLPENDIIRLRFGYCGLSGSCLASQGKNREALTKFEQQIQYARKLLDPMAEAEALSSMANCFTKLGDTEKASNLQQQAAALRSKKDKKVKAKPVPRKKVATQSAADGGAGDENLD
eukprot:TRINITY_DN9798_c0_g1_i3.p1 TRINITY_DN9798_c0_g1~~TRINITY_DN9798_c0_g1_i3.p1  ORF type:complete len:662 (+),score=147.99 TRINITY_DN9798_c0_g1_i3:693-2678(+)